MMLSSTLENACKGEYFNRRFRREVLPRMQAGQPILCEPQVLRLLEEQGFVFDPEKDNKSVYKPEALFSALENYLLRRVTKEDRLAYERAWAMTFKAFAKPKEAEFLTPMSLEEVSRHVKFVKSSGAPYFMQKGDVIEKDLMRARQVLDYHRAPLPCTAYYRVQHGDEGPKVRLVWGYPQSQTLIEGVYAAPLISSFLSRNTPMAFGMTKLGISAKLQAIANCDYQYGFDFSKFDATVNHRLIARAFEVLKTWFDEKSGPVWDRIINYFIFTPIVMPDGRIYKKSSGIPSGSWFTQLIDSIVNYFAIQYCMIRWRGYGLKEDDILVLGDDSVIGVNHEIDIHTISERASELGLRMNPLKTAKSEMGREIHFLGHVWSFGLPDRPLRDTAKRMAFPERWMNVPYAGKERAKFRIGAYLTDSLSAYQIYRRLPWNRIPNIMGMAIQAETRPLITGWQQYMNAFDLDLMASTPSRNFYLGVLS